MENITTVKNNQLFDVYNGKKVLITGHTGFKGSWLSIWLNELGAEVVGYALDVKSPEDNFALSGISDSIVDIRSDIRDLDALKHVFEIYKPDMVFHLAAQPLVRLSYSEPRMTYETNVMGTINVLECIRESNSVKTAIVVTSDKCYKNVEQMWGYRETDPLGGYDPYSSSKACSEILTSSYTNSYFNPSDYKKHGKAISSVRAGNVIGGGDWSIDRIIPDSIRSLSNNKPIYMRNPFSVRPWQHVLEPLSGYLLLGALMEGDGAKYSGAWNFGPDSASIITVKELVGKLINIWGEGKYIIAPDAGKQHESNLLSLDCTKARLGLNWVPRLDVDEALEYTVSWYKNYKSTDVYNICVSQIKSYGEY